MIIHFAHQNITYSVDLSQGQDISIPLIHDASGPKCFYAPNFRVEPVVAGDFIGSVAHGSPVNFKNIFLNPHGNGTHTECVGHITDRPYTINACLKDFHSVALLISVTPSSNESGDSIITQAALMSNHDLMGTDTIIIRTLPNDREKICKDYSGTNPPYFSADAIMWLNSKGIKHIITDLPSIDREEDGGALAGHRTFWQYPDIPDPGKTITEMVFVPDEIVDGLYFCNIQIAPIVSDASPSKIVLYNMQ